MINAGCGYLKDSFELVKQRLIQLNRENVHGYVTVDDLIQKTDRLRTIVTSGAKGSLELLDYMLKCAKDRETTLYDKQKEMVEAMNLYFYCNRDLRHNGRDQFAVQYAVNDLVIMNFKLYLNKIYIADYTLTGVTYSFLWSEESLILATEDLMELL